MFARHEHHRAKQADGPRAQDEGAQAQRLPGIAPQDGVQVDGGLRGDRQRLDQDAHLREARRNADQVPLVLDDQLGHEAVGALDAPLAEAAGDAEVLTPRAAGDARGVVAGPAYGQRDEIARAPACGRSEPTSTTSPSASCPSTSRSLPAGGVP